MSNIVSAVSSHQEKGVSGFFPVNKHFFTYLKYDDNKKEPIINAKKGTY